ncbi:MAG: hypothetical protein EBU33_06520, partial [Sphingobacteriia bacterium]|nr:hypothetical protein [Sphingobacteriia bacterium]
QGQGQVRCEGRHQSSLFVNRFAINHAVIRNANGTYAAGETYGTEKKAADKCKSLSAGDTNCYVK